MRAIESNGVTLHAALFGRHSGVAIVLVNSLGTDLRVWKRVVDRLAPGFRLVCYDKRGHGLSTVTPAPYTLDDHVADLAGLLEALELGPAVIVGLSVGGLIAQGLAVRRPELVRALVLCDTAHRIGSEQIWDGRIEGIRAGGLESIADGVVERWFTAAFRRDRPRDVELWRNMLTRTPVDGYVGTCHALRDSDLGAELGSIAVPTLCLAGSEDSVTPPEVVAATAARIRGGRFVAIDDAGHLPSVEQPHAMATQVASFIEEHGFDG